MLRSFALALKLALQLCQRIGPLDSGPFETCYAQKNMNLRCRPLLDTSVMVFRDDTKVNQRDTYSEHSYQCCERVTLQADIEA
jgi:hypothetical protein